MPRRVRTVQNPVTITLDGEPVVAERGEPLAAALLAADESAQALARSPKYHRPRGPSCMRGACDGCLARVDETPNVMTCMVGAGEGMTVVTQNRLGPREADLLRMTDWFFPDGLNHHELFAGVPGLQSVMQVFARRVAGLGRLPGEEEPERKARRRSVDALVVGAGPAGMAIAVELARAGRSVELLEDHLELGGGLRALSAEHAAPFAAIRRALDEVVASGKVQVRTRTTAGGLYGRDLLVVDPHGAEVVEASTLVLACGAHDGALAFEGNDVPGVMSARAAGLLLASGVLVGTKIAVVVAPGGGPFGLSFAAAVKELRAREGVTLGDDVAVEVVRGDPVAVRGASRAKSVRVRQGRDEIEVDADAVVIDAPRSPAYELCEQAGATLVHEARGYVAKAERGKIARGVYAVGEVAGTAFDATAIVRAAKAAAEQIALDSRAG